MVFNLGIWFFLDIEKVMLLGALEEGAILHKGLKGGVVFVHIISRLQDLPGQLVARNTTKVPRAGQGGR